MMHPGTGTHFRLAAITLAGLNFAYDLSPMTRSAQTLPTRLDTEEIQYSVPVGWP